MLLRVLAVLALAMLTIGNQAAAQTETVLYNFDEDVNPLGHFVFDKAGNLYGTANGGEVFELMPRSHGSWTEKTIYNLASGGFSYSAGGVIFDIAGNLYGSSLYGGSYMDGVAFELTPQKNGDWKASILHNFGKGRDGQLPNTALTFDSAGNLYGTTLYGGVYDLGTVFELSPRAGGWTEKVLHSFGGSGSDGQYPYSTVIFDASGNLYATTDAGGAYGGGTAYEFIPQKDGSWKEKILHNFGGGEDGSTSYSKLIFDAAGNLYGTTAAGGSYKYGTAFELMPQDGKWKEKILHNFGKGKDGIEPLSGLIFDAAGNLYGTTSEGGAIDCGPYYAGTAFELKPEADGEWSETRLESFCENNPGGGGPGTGGLIFGASGKLYGLNYAGGTYDGGTAFDFKP
jgi:uncharacterized repeat protein (TIGR03803 family)